MTYSPPLISIILPTYNGSKYIRRSIESCLNQDYCNIELIIVNDASTDNTPDIIKEYQHLDRRVKVIHHSSNQKLPAALNTGFSASKGEYLTWTSDDNMYTLSAITKMFNFLRKNTKYSMVYANYTKIDDSAKSTPVRNPYLTDILFGNPIGACFLYTRAVYQDIGNYCTNSFLAEDYEYWARVFERFEIAHLDSDLYRYSCHSSSLTASYPANTILERTSSAREKLLRVFISNPTKAELESFLKLNRSQEFQYQDLLCISRLLEKLIDHHNEKKISTLEFATIISQKQKSVFRVSAIKHGPSLWPIYWKFKYRQRFSFKELLFFLSLLRSWLIKNINESKN